MMLIGCRVEQNLLLFYYYGECNLWHLFTRVRQKEETEQQEPGRQTDGTLCSKVVGCGVESKARIQCVLLKQNEQLYKRNGPKNKSHIAYQ